MKAYTAVVGTLLIAGAAVSAQAQSIALNEASRTYLSVVRSYTPAHIQRAVKNYAGCLESTNIGVVESALAHVARMKLIFPATESKELAKRIEFLTVNGQTPAIRYKAYLTLMVFDSPEIFGQVGQKEFQEDEEVFTTLAMRLQETLLGYSGD